MKNKKKIIIISISTIAIVLMITLAIILNKNTNGDRIIQSTKNSLEEYQENETKVLNLDERNDNLENAVDNDVLAGNTNGEIERNIQENQQEVDSKQNNQADKKTSTTQTKVKSTTSNNQQKQQILQNNPPIPTQNKSQSNLAKNITEKQEKNKQTTTEKKENQSKQTTSQTKSSSSTNKRENPDPLDNCKKEKHSISVGNSKKWFNSHEECNQYYIKVISKWGEMLENGEITWEEYNKKCPKGYEDFSCMYCGKYTLDFYYN